MKCGPAQAAAGAGSQVAVRVHQRAGIAVHDGRLCAHGGARWCRGQARLSGSSSHAAPRLWFCAGQQGPRYPGPSGLLGPSKHPAHSALHRAVIGSVQALLAIAAPADPAQREYEKRFVVQHVVADTIPPGLPPSLDEKSDPAIVAVKLTNKAGQLAAELVEPRAGAEGNVRQQSTGRAQYRVTVSQALEHIRNFVRISRHAVTYPRWEPCARIGLARICAGGAR